jgi:lactate dehydrogenase-like 2-hydroxyacid dehydrogenase
MTRCARALYEGIDLEASEEMGITVSNGFFDGVAVSEHTLMLILALLRKLIPSHASMVMESGRSLSSTPRCAPSQSSLWAYSASVRARNELF